LPETVFVPVNAMVSTVVKLQDMIEEIYIATNAPSGGDTYSIDTNPEAVAHNAVIPARAIIKLNQEKEGGRYFWNHPEATVSELSVKQWSSDWFVLTNWCWDKVIPKDKYYSPAIPFEYQAVRITHDPEDPWTLPNIGGAENNIGVMRYAVQATLVETASTPDETAVETTGDRHIKNTVFRLVVKGNYGPKLLQWASAQINVPYVDAGATWPQACNYLGVDCSSMVSFAMKKSGRDCGRQTVIGLYDLAQKGQQGLQLRHAQNEEQKLTMVGNPTGGTFKLAYDEEETDAIPYDATADSVETALSQLDKLKPSRDASIYGSSISVSGNAGGPWTVTFVGLFSDMDLKPLTADGSQLAGGTNPDVWVNTEFDGVPPTPQAGDVLLISLATEKRLSHTLVYALDEGSPGLTTNDDVIHASSGSKKKVVKADAWFAGSSTFIKIASFAPPSQ